MLRTLPFRGVQLRRLAKSSAGISIVAPVSPQPPSAPVFVSGTYGGSPASITLVWRQDDQDVGAPVVAGTVANGQWSGTITTPATPGSYVLRAAFDGAAPTADSLPIEIASTAGVQTVAAFTFEGTGSGANAITLFGHAFEAGKVQPTDPVLLRRQDNDAELRAQLNALSTWGDGSVKTALIAAELPDLADTTTLATNFRVGEAHSAPGSDLDFSTALAGRTLAIKTWAPGNTTTPLWTYNPLASIGADRWHEGPLALSTRVETTVPSSAVLNTSDAAGVIESVRLVVDVVVTKDGFLEADVCFSNDRLPYTSQDQTGGGYAICGIARFGYTIEIDGTVVYDQRPASGVPRDLLQYSQWIRRRGRRTSDGRVVGWSNHRPFARPDLDGLVASGVQTNYLRARPVASAIVSSQCDALYDSWATRETDPYWNGLANSIPALSRYAGAVGGRPEIGDRPFSTAYWLIAGTRKAQLLSHLTFEAAATRPMYYRDWEDGDWLYPPTWPRFTTSTLGGTSPVGTPKSTAISTALPPTHNQTDHIQIEHAHHGSFNFGPAVLSGRRLAYDSMAARSAWIVMDNRFRHVPGVGDQFTTIATWRGTVTPNYTTGAAWGPRHAYDQTRTASWDMRCLIDADIILPDAWPNRARYSQHVQAFFNAYAAQTADIHAKFDPSLGTPWFSGTDSGRRAVTYQLHFNIPSFVRAQKCGVGGANRDAVIEEWVRGYCAWMSEPTFLFRNFMSGRSVARATENNATDAKSWADVQTYTAAHSLLGNTSEDWTVKAPSGGDYLCNGNMGLANILYEMDVPLELKAYAADALVLCTSERIRTETGVDNMPTQEPQSYYNGYVQTNAAWPKAVTTERNVAPTITPGQTFQIAGDAQNGDIIGIVEVTGVLPRQSTFGTATTDSFTLVSQPAGNPVSISRGGVLRVADKTQMPGTQFNITVKCRTDEQRNHSDPPGTAHESATVAVSITPVSVAPVLTALAADGTTPSTSWTIPSNATAGSVIGYLDWTGTEPITLSEQSGDTQNVFAIAASGKPRAVQVGGSLSGLGSTNYNVIYRATGPTAFDEETVNIAVTGAVTAPGFPDQTISIAEGVAVGTDATPVLTNSGGAATSLSITAGNSAGRFAAVAPNVIKSAATLARAEGTQYVLTVEATNAIGSDTAQVTVNVTQASYVYDIPNTIVLAMVSAARRLRGSYSGPLLRAYIDDSTYQDIGVDGSGNLDVTALETFANGAQVTAALYDQGPLVQGLMTPHTGGRPFITNTSGKVLTVGANSRPTLRFESARGLRWPSFKTAQTAEFGTLMMVRNDTADAAMRALLTLATSMNTSPASSVSTSFLLRSNGATSTQLYRNSTGTVVAPPNNTLPNQTPRVVGAYTLSQTNRRRAISVGGTFWNATDTADWTAMAATAHMNFGCRSDTAGVDWVGEIAEAVIVGALDLAADQPAILAGMQAFYAVS